MKIMVTTLALLVTSPLVCLSQTHPSNVVPTNLPGIATHIAPPAGFDARTASDSDLAYYGFPPRPAANSKGYESWANAVNPAVVRISPQLKLTNVIHGPRKGGGNPQGGEFSSYNWSGYANLSGPTTYNSSTSFYYVEADFNVPMAEQPFGSCSGGWDYGSSWVGIDGAQPPVSNDVLQAGIEYDAFCKFLSNQTEYYAWFEWYPNGSYEIYNLPVKPGDQFYVEVWHTSQTAGDAYIVNYNANEAAQISFSIPNGATLVGDSAEWIVERPSVNGEIATLTNYINDPFWGAAAVTEEYDSYAPGNSDAVIMLDNNGNEISYPTLWNDYTFLMQDTGSAR